MKIMCNKTVKIMFNKTVNIFHFILMNHVAQHCLEKCIDKMKD